MVEILAIVCKLYELRDVPQFLFIDGIFPSSTLVVRSEILAFKKANPDADRIDFIINSPGGSPADAYRIIRTLRNNFEEVNVIVPFWAKSAATLLSLGATNIIMDEFGEFGPLDIQIGVEREDSPEIDRESALNDEFSLRQIELRSQELYCEMFANLYSREDVKINKNDLSSHLLRYLADFYEPLLKQINPYNLGKKKRLLNIGEEYANRILAKYLPSMDAEERGSLIDFLVNGSPDHGYVIDYNIINLFMENVKPSSSIGAEYEEVLRKLTTELIPLGDEEYIGFVAPLIADIPEEHLKILEGMNQKGRKTVIEGKHKIVHTKM